MKHLLAPPKRMMEEEDAGLEDEDQEDNPHIPPKRHARKGVCRKKLKRSIKNLINPTGDVSI